MRLGTFGVRSGRAIPEADVTSEGCDMDKKLSIPQLARLYPDAVEEYWTRPPGSRASLRDAYYAIYTLLSSLYTDNPHWSSHHEAKSVAKNWWAAMALQDLDQ